MKFNSEKKSKTRSNEKHVCSNQSEKSEVNGRPGTLHYIAPRSRSLKPVRFYYGTLNPSKNDRTQSDFAREWRDPAVNPAGTTEKSTPCPPYWFADKISNTDIFWTAKTQLSYMNV